MLSLAANSQIGLTDDLIGKEYNSFVFKDSTNQNIWISSLSGWNKVNGKEVITYELGKEISDEAGYVQSNMFQETNGDLWFTSISHLYRYEQTIDSFYQYKLYHKQDSIRGSYHLFHLRDDILYLSADNSIFEVDISNIDSLSTQKLMQNHNSARFKVIENKNEIENIICMPWIMSEGFKLYSIDNDSLIHVQSPVKNVSTKDVVVQGSIFYFASTNGLWKYDILTKASTFLKPKNTRLDIESVEQLNSEQLLLSTLDNELWLFDLVESTFEKLKLSKNKNPREIQKLKNGVISISNRGNGVNLYCDLLKTPILKHFKNVSDFTIGPELHTLSKEGVLKYENRDVFDDPIDGYTPTKNCIVGYQKNMIYLKKENQNPIEYKINSPLTNLTPRVFQIEELEQPNSFIINTSLGLKKYLINEDEIAELVLPKHFDDYRFIQIFGNGRDLVGVENGNELVIIKNEKFIKRIKIPGNIASFSFSDFVNEIGFVNTNNGVYELDLSYNIQPLIDVSQYSFPHESYSSDIDKDRNLWISSSLGIIIVNLNSREIYRAPSNKLGLKNISSTSEIQIDSSRIYFRNNDDLFVLSPLINQDYSCSNPKISFKTLEIDGIPKNARLKELENLELSHDNQYLNISLDVAGDYFDKGILMYKFHPDEQWISTNDISSKITIYPLTPEIKQLEIKYFDSYFRETDSKKISINIAPPFHQTWWFYSLVAVSLIASGFGINYFITRQKLKEKQRELDRQKALSSQREKIAHDLHDELGTELNKILYLSDEAQYVQDDTRKEKLLDDIGKLAGDSIRNMRDILWVLDDKNDTLQSLVSRIRLSMNQNLTDYEINLIAQIPDELPVLILDNAIRKNILLIAKEATNNIIKHARAKSVVLQVALQNNKLKLKIIDDGVGFDYIDKPDSYGLKSMKKRATTLNGKLSIMRNKETSGTIIALSVALGGALDMS